MKTGQHQQWMKFPAALCVSMTGDAMGGRVDGIIIQPDWALKENAEEIQRLHDPDNQSGSDTFPNRCKLCHYTRHPCDEYWAATVILYLLARLND